MRYSAWIAVILMYLTALPAFSTTICWDGKHMAADGQSTMGHRKLRLDVKKIEYSAARHATIAAAGNALRCEIVMDYFRSSTEPLSHCELPDPKNEDDCIHVLVVSDSGVALFYGGTMTAISMVDAPFAMGTGGEMALGYMFAGKTAEEAIKMAKENDLYTGGLITVIEAPKVVEATELDHRKVK